MFCPNGSFFYEWKEGTNSECFVDTGVASIISIFMIIFGTAQWSVYRKYSTPLSQAVIPQSKLYCIQMIITLLLPILSVAKFFVDVYLLQNGVIYGFQVSFS